MYAFYTDEIHAEFEKLYNYVGKNTFQIYGREVGQLLYEKHNLLALQVAETILPNVINSFSFPPQSLEGKEKDQQMTAEVLARRLLSSSWDGIGGWES